LRRSPLLPVAALLFAPVTVHAQDDLPPTGDPVIDVLALYTPNALRQAGGLEGVQAYLELTLAETHASFVNSGVKAGVRFVHVAEVAYDDRSSMFNSLRHLTDPHDGFMDEVPALRSRFGADLVVLYISNQGWMGGVASGISRPSPTSYIFAHAVVGIGSPTWVSMHEMGHLLGSWHDRRNSPDPTQYPAAYPYSYGYVFFGPAATIMASGWENRLYVWSSPLRSYDGSPTGLDHERDPDNSADNVRSLNQMAPFVSDFVRRTVVLADPGPDRVVSDRDGSGAVSVRLDARRSDPAELIQSYAWFENACPIARGTVAATRLGLGDHLLELRVRADQGPAGPQEDRKSFRIRVAKNLAPEARPRVEREPLANADVAMEVVTLDGTDSFDPDGRITSYEWFLRDHRLATGPRATVPLSPGVHPVTLVVRDDGNPRHSSPPLEARGEVAVKIGTVFRVPQMFPTIQAAINAVDDGDTVVVSPGVYTGPGNVDVNFRGKYIRVTAEGGPAATIIDLQGAVNRGFVFGNVEKPSSILEGFAIARGWANRGGAVLCDGASPTLRGNVLIGNYAEKEGGAVSCEFSAARLVGNVFYGNVSDRDGGAFSGRFFSGVMENNLVVLNRAAGYGGGLSIYEFTGALVNCAVANNSAGTGGGASIEGSWNPPRVTNCIFWGNQAVSSPGIYEFWSPRPAQVTFSNVQGMWVWPGAGNINRDPRFVDPVRNDFSLGSFSPCIDAADGDAAPAVDAAGRPRVDDPAVRNTGAGRIDFADMGWLERQPP